MKKVLFTLLALIGIFCLPAQASAAQTVPNWCYEYPVSDSFNAWGNWGLWNSSNSGTTQIKNVSSGTAKTAPGALLMSYAASEPNGSFMALDRYISMTGETTHAFSKCGGSAPVQSFTSKAKFCAANVYARTSQGAHLAVQILDPDSYVLLANSEIDLPASNVWSLISTPLAFNCRTDVVVRLVLLRTPSSASVIFDDFNVLWYY